MGDFKKKNGLDYYCSESVFFISTWIFCSFPTEYTKKNRLIHKCESAYFFNYKFNYLYPSSCTLFTERPDGSFKFLKDASHSNAIGVLQATEGTEGTHNEAASEGK